MRKSVEEILRIQKGEDDSHADFISARKAAQILGIKTSRLRQIVGEYEAAGEKIRAGRNRYDAHKIRTIARLRAGQTTTFAEINAYKPQDIEAGD